MYGKYNVYIHECVLSCYKTKSALEFKFLLRDLDS